MINVIMKLVIVTILVSLCGAISQYHRRIPVKMRSPYVGELQFERVIQSKDTEHNIYHPSNHSDDKIPYSQYNSNWIVHRMLGQGATAKVYLVQDAITSQFKVVKKYSSSSDIQNQHHILNIINHPINYTKCPNSESSLTVHNYFESSKNLSNIVLQERQVKILIYKLIFQLNKIHQKRIIHSDIKASNVIIDVKMKNRKEISEKLEIRIIDWNLALEYYEGKRFVKFHGTPKYMAPELLVEHEYYTPAIDVWSLGMLMFRVVARESMIGTSQKQIRELVKLFGYEEFMRFYRSLRPRYNLDIIKQINRSKNFTQNSFEKKLKDHKLSLQQITFIKKLITLQPQNRPSLKQLLTDQYFTDVRQFYQPGHYKALKKKEKKTKNSKDD